MTDEEPQETPRPSHDARGKFAPGHRRLGGRSKGARDKVSRAIKTSIKRVAEQIGTQNPELFYEAFKAGLEAKPPASFPYLQLAAWYLDGKPTEKITIEETRRRFVVILRSDADPLAAPLEAVKEIALEPRLGLPPGPSAG